MRALVFGSGGQVGRELLRQAPACGIAAQGLGRSQADLSDDAACARLIREADAEIVVNAAAYTAVDAAEDEADVAHAVNAAAPGAMASAAAGRGLPFLHISTDYVFDGASGAAKREGDPTGPLGAYGASKLAGERLVRAAGGPHVILRTAWVFSAHGRNFVRTMLAAGRARDELRVVGDQTGGPTAAADIAAALWGIAGAWAGGRGVPGTFHFAGAPATSWAGFAEEIFRRSGWQRRPRIVPITTAEWPTKARRPANSVLDCAAIGAAYGIAQPDWRPALDAVLNELGQAAA